MVIRVRVTLVAQGMRSSAHTSSRRQAAPRITWSGLGLGLGLGFGLGLGLGLGLWLGSGLGVGLELGGATHHLAATAAIEAHALEVGHDSGHGLA